MKSRRGGKALANRRKNMVRRTPTFGAIAAEIKALPDLVAWFQIDAKHGVSIADNDVAGVADFNGSDLALVQADINRRPIYLNEQPNGLSGMIFDGSTALMHLSTNRDFTAPHSFAFIAKRNVASGGVLYGSNITGSTAEFLWYNAEDQIELKQSNRNVHLAAPPIGQYELIVASVDGNGGIKLMVGDSMAQTTGGDNGASENAPLIIGSLNNTGSQYFNGAITDAFIFDRAILDDNDVDLNSLKELAFFSYGIGK